MFETDPDGRVGGARMGGKVSLLEIGRLGRKGVP